MFLLIKSFHTLVINFILILSKAFNGKDYVIKVINKLLKIVTFIFNKIIKIIKNK